MLLIIITYFAQFRLGAQQGNPTGRAELKAKPKPRQNQKLSQVMGLAAEEGSSNSACQLAH